MFHLGGRASKVNPHERVVTIPADDAWQRELGGLFEKRPRQAGLSDYARQSACSDGVVKRNRNRDGRRLRPLLHDAMTAALADREETMLLENLADLQARKNSKPTQPGPRPV